MGLLLTATEIAVALGVKRQAVNNRIEKKRFDWQACVCGKRQGPGGGALYDIDRAPLTPEERNKVKVYYATKHIKSLHTSPAAAAGVKAAMKLKEETAQDAEDARRHRERCLSLFNQLPEPKQRSARAKAAVLDACGAFLAAGGYRGRAIDGKNAWHKGGVGSFCAVVKRDTTALESWVMEVLQRKGQPSLGYRTIIRWREARENDGLYGLADKYESRAGNTSLTREQQEFVIACKLEHPHISITKLMSGLEARFSGSETPSYWAVWRFVKTWDASNKSLLLYLANPDEWKNKYMYAVGSASENVVRLNQVWEADSTPGDLMLTDGRHAIVGIVDVWSRRLRLLVTPTSRSAAIAALFRRCVLEWGVCEAFKTDNGQDYVADYLEQVLAALEVTHEYCTPFSPEEKPHIERALQTMSHGIVELLPGYIGHSVADRKAIEARETFAKRLMSRGETIEVKLTSVDLQKLLDRWTDAMYMQDPHTGLDGKSPAAMARDWTGAIRKVGDERALDMLLLPAPGDGGWRVIGKKGIRVTYGAARLDYWAVEFAGHAGERVQVRPDYADLGHAAVYLESGAFLCWAEDPTWYGISRDEAANHLRNKQRQVMQEGAKELKAKARALKTRDIAYEILEHREAELRAAGEKVLELPRRSIEHTTNALQEAARAADIRQRGPVAPPPTPEQVEARQRLEAEIQRTRETGVASLPLATAKQRYRRYKELKATLAAGRTISEDDYRGMVSYERSSECKGFAMMEDGEVAVK